MPDYQKGKIYKVCDNGYNHCYIVSSIEALSSRMSKHRESYKLYLQGKAKYVCIYDLFDEFGCKNCKIELVELYPCNSKAELHSREGHYQQKYDCINKRIAGRSQKQYQEDNRELVSMTHKKYYQKYKEEIKARVKEYSEKNREAVLQNKRDYYINRKEEIKEQRKVKMTCECGSTFRKCDKADHYKTNKHQQYLKSLNHEEPPTTP